MRRVRIKSMAYGGNTITPPYRADQYSQPETRFNKTLTSVPIDEANIEAEGGETALVPDVNGIPAHYNIEGPRHSQGGVPLNMPDNSFIYSDTAKMKIKDPEILKMFDYSDAQIKKIKKSRGITPADIAKKYDINKHRELLEDEHSNKIERKTAELNIKNANLKLAQLALYQESMKGFPDGIPSVALPFLGKFGIDPSSFLPVTEESVQQAQVPEAEMPQEEMMEPPMAQDGQSVNNLLNELSNYQVDYTKQPDVLVDENAKLKLGTASPYLADMMLAGLDIAGNVARLRDERRREDEFRKRTQSDYLYSDTQGDQGAYDVNTGEFKPSQMYRDPVQFTGAATYAKYGGGLRKFVYETGGEFNPEEGVYLVYKNGEEVYMDANDVPAPEGWSPDEVNRIPEAKYGMQVAQDGAEKQSKYNKVEKTFRGNEKLKQLLYEKTLAALQNEAYLNKNALKRKGVDIDKAIAELTPDKALEAFLSLQKRNYGIVENKGANWIVSQSQSNPSAFDKAYSELGLGDANPLNVALGQAAYLGYRDLLTDRDEGLLDSEVAADLKPFRVYQVGKQDESYGFDPQSDISKIDAIGTNTTVGQLAGVVEPEPAPEAVTEEPEPEPVPDIPLGEIGELATPTPPAGPYPQDVLSMGEAFANRMGLKKYYPWAPKVEPVLPQPTFFDPRRAEANIMGAYNTALTQLGAFASPQQLSARASEVAGNAMSAVADTVGQIQNQNVAVANQFETQRAGILNNNNLTNASQAKALYDQTTLMNQQYDNAKRDARNKLLGTIKNTITNMATTDVINDVYGNRFRINPTTGGQMEFYNPPSTISPAQQGQDRVEQYAALREKFKGTDISDDALLKLVFGVSDTPVSSRDTDAMAAISAMPRKYGGGVRKVRLKKAPK